MRRSCFIVAALAVSGCGDRGSVTFDLTAPTNPLFNPVAQPELVSEYDIRTASGTVIGIASAVQGSGQSDNGLLPLGALMPVGEPEDIFVTAMSGGNLLGMARIRDVTIKPGKKTSYEAPLRKPLIFVGSSMPPEKGAENGTRPVQILDPVASIDLAKSPPVVVAGGMTAGATTWDGRFLVVAQGNLLTAFDTGSGTTVAGTLSLGFQPSRLVVAPRDSAIVALDPGPGSGPGNGAGSTPSGSLVIIDDVAGFVASPGSVTPKIVRMPGAIARTATFSPDGSKLYVLTGGPSSDPCVPGAVLAANAIEVYALDGSMTDNFTLPGFAADLAVDPLSGTLVVADVAGKQIATFDPASGAVTRLLGNLTCPSAVRVVNGTAFVVTNDRDRAQPGKFLLQRVPIKGGSPTATPFSGPSYDIPIPNSMPSANGGIGVAMVTVQPVSIDAYELAITPDGSRAEFATRTVYDEAGSEFVVFIADCVARFNIVEYGLFAVDIRTGNASYQVRSQLVQTPANGSRCVACTLGMTLPIDANCGSTGGDRPAGLAASFGQ